jgi:hypothetical protein
MNQLWVDIETLVLDGVPLSPSQGRRLTELTERALARLLEQRGTATRISCIDGAEERQARDPRRESMRAPENANEA